MRLKLILCMLIGYCASLCAQTQYDITSAGQGRGGDYYVKVTTTVKKVKDAKDALLRSAVHGVIFKGFSAGSDGGTNQKPLVSDPSVERTKADFFNAFFNEKQYERYTSMTESSMTSAKVKKGYECSALITVQKEALQHLLEEKGIIKGFSNLW